MRQTKLWKFFSSIKLAIWLFTIICALSMIGTFIAQNEESAFYINRYGQYGYNFLLKTGLTDVYNSWWFILPLILISLNLTACILNRISFKGRQLGAFICHVSVLVILAGALIGMLCGQKGYIKINKGQEANFFEAGKKHIDLGFSIRLDDFIYNESIDPKEKLSVYDGKLIAEIPTAVGAEQEIAGAGYKIKILRYLPDFVMDMSTKEASSRSANANNPAIQVEFKDKDGSSEKFWVFARYPDIHQAIKTNYKFVYNWVGRRPNDFISKITVIKDGKEALSKDIRVNSPVKFQGYIFFQQSYDQERLNWSGLKVVKDPGVSVVYLGFILFILGLSIRFYINPLLRRK